ncbi:membrane dipeptidase [Pedobacter sp. Du54]|uniref:membrane dipeptidase n=1 Tax=Pedobacter anseongensis TaxID=3133439 RepID=UPI0030A091FE
MKLFFLIVLSSVSLLAFGQYKPIYFNGQTVVSDSTQANSYGVYGKLSGEELYALKIFDLGNNLLTTGTYKDEKLTVPHGAFVYYSSISAFNNTNFTNFVVKDKERFISGKGSFIDGKKSGRWIMFYPDGKIMSITTYVNDVKHGYTGQYSRKGKPIISGSYFAGERDGEWLYDKGKVKETYIKGVKQLTTSKKDKKKAIKTTLIHENAIVVDTHGDILFNQIKSGIDIGKPQATGNFDLPRAKQGGLDVQVFSIWCDETGGYAVANREIDSLYSLIKRYPKQITLVRNYTELMQAVEEKKLAAMIGVEGGHMIENNLDNLDQLAKRGMSYLTLTWNNSTPWASSAAEETSGKVKPERAGLNDFGKKVVTRLNKLGVLVDLSHVGERTFYDAIKVTTKPVLVSHSCVYALNPVPRNLKDDQIKAIGKNGGVISLNFYNGFLDSAYKTRQKVFLTKYDLELKKLTQKYGRSDAIDTLISLHKAESEAIRTPVSVIVDHIDYIIKLIGADHVGLGADFDGAESFPAGINGVADYPKITQALVDRGYQQADIEKILGGNFLRLLKAQH